MAINYPSFLPTPQRSTVSPAEARQLSDPRLPVFARAISTENRQFESLQWPAMSSADHEALMAWWKDDLVYGGAWFNATWPLPRGRVPAVRQFVKAPRRVYAGGGMWRTTAVCEVRGLGVQVVDGRASDIIAWFDPIGGSYGSLAHANSGTAPLYGIGAQSQLFAGLTLYDGQVVSWSIASWTSGTGDAAPFFFDAADGWTGLQWNNKAGWDPDFPFTYDGSIGTLVLTASIDGVPIAAGQRLVAVSTPPTLDYPDVAWGPE